MPTILLIDDSKFSRTLAKAALGEAGYQIIEAEDGEQGLAQIRSHQPDCVMLELLMPVLDGPGFLARLRGEGSNLPVIVLSADIQSSSRTMCEELGISGFLNKPWKAPDLLRLVSEVLTPISAGQ